MKQSKIQQPKRYSSKQVSNLAATSHLKNEEYMITFDKVFNTMTKKKEITDKLSVNNSKETEVFNSTPITSFHDSEALQHSPSDVNKLLNLHPSWYDGPSCKTGKLMKASSQPLVCMSILYEKETSKEMVVGSCDHSLYVFDLSSGKKVRQLYSKKYGHQEWLTCVLHLFDGRIVSGGMDSKLCLWERKGNICKDLLGHQGSISKIQTDHNSSFLFSSSYDKSLKLWDIKKMSCCRSFLGHSAPILDFHSSFNDNILVSGSRDGVAIVWDIENGKSIRKFNDHKGHLTSIAKYNQELNKSLYLTGGQDGFLRVYDIRSPQCLFNLKLHANQTSSGALCSIKCSLNPECIVTAGADKTIQVLDLRNSFKKRVHFDEHSDFIYSLETCGGLVLSGSGNGMLLVHDLNQEKLLYGLGANQAAIRCIHATENTLVAAGDDGNAILYNFS